MARPKKIKITDTLPEVESIVEAPVPEVVEPVEVVNVVTVVPLPQHDKIIVIDPAEGPVSVIANGSFHDGAFKHDFEKLGYKVHWKDQEVRNIPARLYAKLMRRSGGKFVLKGDK